ncbi:eCIS core domain-containing protein [Nostoc sp.]|uniref:eCIS core domain-containing protein n=1 Tax=Nostoc sp. TaxID=1180 RepID=UPI002FF6DD68
MREHVSQSKKATTASFSIPSLKHRIPGFGLDSSQASPQAVPLVQPLHKPLTHDISRMSLHRPQAKLSISQPGDKYEQEADSVAQQVMQRMGQPVNRQSIQREALPEEEELQMKPMANFITPLVQRQEMPEEEEELQMKSLDNNTLQRQEAPEDEEELQMKPMVQRQALMAAAPDIEASINQARGGGQAMAENIRHPMERAFGADFSGVKVHTDSQSDQLNRSIQARAFTTGHDVFFRQGEYNPGSRGGQELLAHELTHVVQQNGGAVQRTNRPTIYKHLGEVQRKPEKKEGKEGGTHVDDLTGVELEELDLGEFMVLTGSLKGTKVRYESEEKYYYTENADFEQTEVQLGEGKGGAKEEKKEEEVELVDPNKFVLNLRDDLQEYSRVESIEMLIQKLNEKAKNEELKVYEKDRAADTLKRVLDLSNSPADSWPAIKVSGQTVDQGNHRILVAIIRKEKIKVKK